MKHVCVAVQNWWWRGARCRQYREYCQVEQRRQRRFWPQPRTAL